MESRSIKSGITDAQVGKDTLKTSWHFYEGVIGIYEQQVVIELGIMEKQVSGRYFYARHQKFLALTGTIDTLSNTLRLTESYNGKTTGYITCTMDENGNLEGSWSKKQDMSDPQPFSVKELKELYLNEREQLNVFFNNFERKHVISVYNGISNVPSEEKVTDALRISHLNETYFVFDYSVIGGNAHLGNIEGIGTMQRRNRGLYTDSIHGCSLRFDFHTDSIVVSEEEDCSYYRGMRVHFGNTLYR